MITRNFTLYLNAGHAVPLVINVNQYDVGEQWVFSLINGNGVKYTPSTGAIVGIKSDGLGIINSGSVNADGDVVINETQQMTAAVGKNVYELLIDDQTHGTANFIVLVEPKPGDQADFSESDLSLLQQAIDGTSATAIAQGVSDWMDDNLTPTTPVVDQSLTVQGAAADAKKTGDEIGDLKSQISSSQGMSAEFKSALETLLSHVAFSGDDPTGRTYLNTLHTAMYPPANLTSITAVYTQSGTVYNTDSLESLKSDLVVTARYSNGTTEIVTSYALSGTLSAGTSTVTVTYGGKTATFTVTVTDPTVLPSEYQKVEWVGVQPSSASSTNAYMSAGVVIANGDALHVELKPFSLDWSSPSPLGCYDGTHIAWELFYRSAEEIALYVSAGTSSGPTMDAYTIGDSWDTADLNFNDESSLNILIYRTSKYAFSGKIKTLTITNSGGTVTHNYIPCYRKADNVIGMYDVVTGTFLTNAGSGTLLKGDNV